MIERPDADDLTNEELARRVREIAMEYCTGFEEQVLYEAAHRLCPSKKRASGLTPDQMKNHARDA